MASKGVKKLSNATLESIISEMRASLQKLSLMSCQTVTCCRTLTYNCYACKIPYKTTADLINHLKLNHILYKCFCCSYSTDKYQSLVQHSQAKHRKTDLLLHCPFCHYLGTYTNALETYTNALEKHILESHICLKLGYYCTQCGYQGTDENDMKNHLNSIHQVDLKFCFCSVESTSASSKFVTKYSHNCSLCNYKSDKSKSLSQHFKDAHWNVVDTSSDESDGYGYNNYGSYNGHQVSSDNGHCFLCDEEIYDDIQEMNNHLDQHDTSSTCLFCKDYL